MNISVMFKYIMQIVIAFSASAALAAQDNVVVASYKDCTTSIKNFLNESTGVISIPKKIDGKNIASIRAMVDFRESHGAYQSNFGFKNVKTGKKIELFREVKISDKDERGDNDWIGTVEGGILGGKAASKVVSLSPGNDHLGGRQPCS